MTSVPRASVVIPVKDAGPRLSAVLDALDGQDLPGGLEIVALDSGSTDGSAALLAARGARILAVPAGEFDHGETRNRGAREARGEIVLFLSQDAVPANPAFARALVETLESDARLAGAFARQEPRAGADPLTRRDLAGWVAASPVPRTVFLDGAAALSPLERYRLCAFDNVASAVRRSLLLRHPFEPSRFGEDVEWGQRMLGLGYGLTYVPAAVVVHSHRRSARSLYRRNYLGHRLLSRLFGLRTVPDAAHAVRAAAGVLASDLGTLSREGAPFAQWLAAPVQAVAATWGQYHGARDEAARRPYPRWA
ncbi:MAG TPA: glycosyltransferase [Vicinamibacteria bacterium]|nr:glycosyltransferase [Vicinamibacteria bacterium]